MRNNGGRIQGQDLFLPLLIVQDVFSDIERTCPTPLKKNNQNREEKK